jgi:hypothetical protein
MRQSLNIGRPGSVVAIATGYGLDGPEFEYLCGRDLTARRNGTRKKGECCVADAETAETNTS